LRKNPLSNMSAHGGIITSEFLEIIRGEKVANSKVQPESFATFNAAAPKNKAELDEWIVDSWDRLRERWDSLSNRYLKMNVSDTRSKWMVPLFKELGFDIGFIKEEIVVDGDDKLRFRLSHRGWISAGAPMLHMVAPSQDLEEAGDGAEEVVRRGRSRSPHDELQAYLNVTKGSKWGIVTNGVLLRILREYYHTTTKGYVEFDIENIFRERSFTDFRALYRIAHASRFLPDKDGVCPLEQFYKESVAAGVTVGENLRGNVKKAIEALGNGFLTPELTKKMIEDEEFCKAYYSELLRVIYRLLFLLFAEQRAMLPTRDSLYAEEYSITRLREMAETRRGKDDHFDLWEGLKVTFHMLKKGCLPLKVFGYNGSLFDDSELAILTHLSCKNEDVLEAIRHLTLVEEERVLKRINYLDLGVSEIGSIYESLLDYAPKVFATEQEIEEDTVAANTFVLDPRSAARKTSGSYYTSPRLIDELIKSALKPVSEDRLSKASEKEKALLSIKVCDPACGSGAFLIAANNFLARELAKLRTRQAEPPDNEVKKAARDVLQHCIYGVDLNPMATELAKVSLWINSCVEDLPLNFLDHHIKCGNSLIGATPELLNSGIPDEAFVPVEGDDKDFAKETKAKNAFERKNKLMVEFESVDQSKQGKEYASLDDFLEKSPDDVEEKKKRYNALKGSANWQMAKLSADAWTAAFFWPLDRVSNPPTEAKLRMIKGKGAIAVGRKTFENIEAIAEQNRFFHWHLEFPDIFSKENGGFDCLLGNPPWERIKLQQKEFFEARDPEIAIAATAANRKALIKTLPERKPKLWREFSKVLRLGEAESKFIRFSGRYLLTAKGDINTYAIFAEHAKSSICPNGLAGIVVPTGIATDETNKEFFGELVDNNQLVSLFDFENKDGLFQSVHRSFKFSLVTFGDLNRIATALFAFFLHNPDQLSEEEKTIEITKEDFSLLNPNTKTCPIFRNKRDLELTKKIYKKAPILLNEKAEENLWGVKFLRMFDMTNDSHLFQNIDTLKEQGFVLNGNVFTKADVTYLPLYEGKMLQLFDHRAASIIINSKNITRQALPDKTTEENHKDPAFVTIPRYWVSEKIVLQAIPNEYYSDGWLFGFKDVTSSTNKRTFIGGVFPFFAVGNKMPLILFHKSISSESRVLLIANMSSRVFDYVTRQKVGGVTLNFFIVSQLPIIPSNDYPPKASEIIKECVLELVYASHDMRPFARTLGYNGPPFAWATERRAELIARIEAIYGILYGLSKQDLEYVFDSFWSTKKQETEQYGEYRSKMVALQYFDKYLTEI
jgi:hypothetical protein